MACIARRRNRWVVDYRDHTGARRWRSFRNRRDAEQALSDILRETNHAAVPVMDPKITVGNYAEQWLRNVTPTLKPATIRYVGALQNHVPTALKRCAFANSHGDTSDPCSRGNWPPVSQGTLSGSSTPL